MGDRLRDSAPSGKVLPAGGLEDVQERPAIVAVDAGTQIEREPEVAAPQASLAGPLLDRMHGEAARSCEPLRVPCTSVQLEKGPAVAGRRVAEAGAAAHRAGFPGQLARREEERIQPGLGRGAGEGADDPGRAV